MIFATHGILKHKNAERISHSPFMDEGMFLHHLRHRASPYVPLEDALVGRGDALTVDDATRAGFEAVILARDLGHSVSWCVNGGHVQARLPYFAYQLSAMLDDCALERCEFDGRTWKLDTIASRRSLRAHLKKRYMKMASRQQTAALVDDLSQALGVDSTTELTLQTVGPEEVAYAASLGVALENHGWSHVNPGALPTGQLRSELALNAAWLQTLRAEVLPTYVPPFGRRVRFAESLEYLMVLADPHERIEPHDHSVVNREYLSLEDKELVSLGTPRTVRLAS